MVSIKRSETYIDICFNDSLLYSVKPAASGGSIFGGGATTNTAAPSTSGTGLFASFGNAANNNASGIGAAPAQPAGTGLFGAKPAENQAPNAAAPKTTSSS